MTRSWLDDIKDGHDLYYELKPKYDELIQKHEELKLKYGAIKRWLTEFIPLWEGLINNFEEKIEEFQQKSKRVAKKIEEEFPTVDLTKDD